MKKSPAEIWPLLSGRSQNPVYRRELARWSAVRAWRRLGLALPAVVFGGAAVILGVPMAVLLPVYVFPLYDWSSFVSAGLAVLLVASEIVKQAAVFSAAMLAALAMSGEAEETNLLKLASLSSRQIALAKLSAALRPLGSLLLIVTASRLILLAAVESTRVLFEMRAALNPAVFNFNSQMPLPAAMTIYQISVWGYAAWSLLGEQVSAALATAAGPAWAVYYVVQPALDALLFTLAALWAVSWSQTRAGKLSSAAGLSAILWIGGYLAERGAAAALAGAWLASTGAFVLAQPRWMPGLPALDSGYIIAGWTFGAMLAIIVVAKLGLAGLLGWGAARRLAD